jgi:hypothetical protein
MADIASKVNIHQYSIKKSKDHAQRPALESCPSILIIQR